MTEELTGTITADGGCVELEDGRMFVLPIRCIGEDGYPEVLIDAKSVGGYGSMHRQSSKPYIGMKVKFYIYNGRCGSNFEILKTEK